MKDIIALLSGTRDPIVKKGSIFVPTDCLYFDGGNVVVKIDVSPRGNNIIISDNGGALDCIIASGREILQPSNRKLTHHVKNEFAVDITEQKIIFLKINQLADIPAIVPVIANASKAFAEKLLSASYCLPKKDIKKELSSRILRLFPGTEVKNNAQAAGNSRRSYSFDIKALHGKNEVLINELTPKRVDRIFTSSFDISRLHKENISIFSIYSHENENELTPEILSLVRKSGSHIIPYSGLLNAKDMQKQFPMLIAS